MGEHGTYYDTLDAAAIRRLRDIYDRYNISRVIDARALDLQWRKDGREGVEQADAIKDLLRYLPAILTKLEANPDAPIALDPAPATMLAGQGADTATTEPLK